MAPERMRCNGRGATCGSLPVDMWLRIPTFGHVAADPYLWTRGADPYPWTRWGFPCRLGNDFRGMLEGRLLYCLPTNCMRIREEKAVRDY